MTDVSPDVAGVFLQYGLLGAVSLLLVYAVVQLFRQATANADSHIAAERARADRHEEELRKLNADVRDKLLPVLVQATQVMAEIHREDRRGRP